jgi:hypothetical protein
MEDVAMKKPNFSLPETDVELDILLHPAQAFEHPSEVLRDPDLTLNEKRAILASWASDACAVEAVPAMRCAPGCERPVQVDEILDALRSLDKQASELTTRYRRLVRRRDIETFRSKRTKHRGGAAGGAPH